MKTLLKVLRLEFLPTSVDAGLLVLRLWLGLSMLILHGWGKLSGYSTMVEKFPDPLGVGQSISLGLAVFAEFFCAFLLAIGLFTRFAAVFLCILMFVAFAHAHQFTLKGPGSGEMAYIYFAGFLTILIAGPGRFALDGKSKA